MFISKQHMTVDPGPTAANTPSGADYCVAGKADLLSSVKKAAAFSFGSEKKGLEFKAKVCIDSTYKHHHAMFVMALANVTG